MSDTPAGLTAREVLQLVKDNFVIISGAAVVTGVALAITFLTAYLLVFDWHLLWFVQYADILTFGLLALGVVAGVLGIFINFLNIWMTWTSVSAQSRRLFLMIVVSLAVAMLALDIWSAWHGGEGITHVVFGASVLVVGIVIVTLIANTLRAINSAQEVNFKRLSWVVTILFFIEAGGLGQYLGRALLETKNSVDIKTKDSAMSGMKVVIVMSRHTVLLKEKDIYIVPTSDITQFHGTVPPFVW